MNRRSLLKWLGLGGVAAATAKVVVPAPAEAEVPDVLKDAVADLAIEAIEEPDLLGQQLTREEARLARDEYVRYVHGGYVRGSFSDRMIGIPIAGGETIEVIVGDTVYKGEAVNSFPLSLPVLRPSAYVFKGSMHVDFDAGLSYGSPPKWTLSVAISGQPPRVNMHECWPVDDDGKQCGVVKRCVLMAPEHEDFHTDFSIEFFGKPPRNWSEMRRDCGEAEPFLFRWGKFFHGPERGF
jgi:hypothetical protein